MATNIPDLTDWIAEVIQAPAPILVWFTADWCGYCRQLRPVLEELAEEGHAVLRVDADRHRGLTREHRVRGLPTVLIYKQGEETARIVGAEPKSLYLDALREPLTRASVIREKEGGQ